LTREFEVYLLTLQSSWLRWESPCNRPMGIVDYGYSLYPLNNVVLEVLAARTSAPGSIVSLRISIFAVNSLITTGTTGRLTVLRILPQETGGIRLPTSILFRQGEAIVPLFFNHSQ